MRAGRGGAHRTIRVIHGPPHGRNPLLAPPAPFGGRPADPIPATSACDRGPGRRRQLPRAPHSVRSKSLDPCDGQLIPAGLMLSAVDVEAADAACRTLSVGFFVASTIELT
jgi:hypothetical protein